MKKFSILALVIAVICAAVCSVKLWFEYELWALLCYAAILFALPFSSFMHELGHMLFGAFAKIKAVPKFSLFGSSSCMLIPKTDENLRKRLIATACGGLAVNFVFILLGIVGLFVSRCAFLTVFLPASGASFKWRKNTGYRRKITFRFTCYTRGRACVHISYGAEI